MLSIRCMSGPKASFVWCHAERISCFNFEKAFSIGLKLRPYGGRYNTFAPAASISSATHLTLVARLIIHHHAVAGGELGNQHPLHKRSITSQFLDPSTVAPQRMLVEPSAAMSVVVCQWPCASLSTSRRPMGAQPRRRVIMVVAQVSPMNTRFAGSNPSCLTRNSARHWAAFGR